MPTEVVMPQMGESIFEGTITKWLKKAGDTVQKDEPLFEISTDKVDAEIPSPVAGVLSEIKVAEGSTVEINTVVAVVTEAGEAQAAGSQADGEAGPVTAELGTTGLGTEVVMPQMGESIFEGTITKWLKKAGDTVQKDEPLFEISTDKVDAEIPSPIAGVLTEIKVAEGATVEINTVVAVIGGAGTASPPNAPAPAASQAASENAPEVATPPARAAGERLRSSPLVKRIANENQLNLEQIPGSGAEGRITKEDVLRWLSQHGPGSAKATAPSVQDPLAPAHQAQPAPAALTGQSVQMSKMRAIIAQRMVESVKTSPHVYTVYKVDMTRISRLRERERAQFEQKHGAKLTLMPFIAAAAIEALKRYPIVNASVEGTTIHYHDHIHLGIAVALEWGLIVPVVTEAEGRSFAQLAQSIGDLAERARAKKLKPEEATGSTFTLTNSGVFGGEFGTPILNQPESAILAIGGLKKEPVVMTDAQGNDSIAIRWMQNFCLGFDHRTIDGADSGKFMSEFKKALENWERPIL
jgi:2-oxoglutarate dehydrogenase E2 component (dihydrolipoamide succinyltransferase)